MRKEQINLKLSVEEKRLLENISNFLGLGLATFVRQSAISKANSEKIILQQLQGGFESNE